MRHVRFPGPMLELIAAGEGAVRQVPPAFPLTATVAVNPYLGQAGEDRATASARLARTTGARLARDRAEVAAMIADGRIAENDLAGAAAAAGMALEALRQAANAAQAACVPLPTVAGLVREATGTDWPDVVAERIGLWAATRFDAGQALWPAPEGEVFASWRAFATRDLTPDIFGLPGFSAHAAALPDDPRMAFAAACDRLGLRADAAPVYLHRLLATLDGWAQLVRGRGWVAERDGGQDRDTFAMLTVRLTWEAALLDAHPALEEAWDAAQNRYAAPLEPDEAQRIDLALQDAADRAAERRLVEAFADAPGDRAPARPAIQAAFCIDVRSEVLRRAMEAADPEVETIGFAGFFGLPLAHRPAASDVTEAHGPVLLPTGPETAATLPGDADMAARVRLRLARAWGRFRMATVSAFAFVEAAGPLYVGKLARDALGLAHDHARDPLPAMDMPPETRITSAAAILRAMSLTANFAPVVLIAGHGARVVNAPFASALQCGACGGHAGDVNARVLVALLNDAAVREGLAGEGIDVPSDTVFVAGLHDTVSDEVTLFDLAPGTDVARLRSVLATAAMLTRTERAAALPRAGDPATLPSRGDDWAEVRPEWGLAGCAAFVAAPRAATRGRDLRGRAFLHSYDHRADEGYGILELILTAPVVVASWIALQYHGSTVSPGVFGSGNKLLHNVTGGIGVIEGSGGHLRAGLPWQSVHDGTAFRHEPVRLSVVVAAPTEAIDGILGKHPAVAALFDNGWLALMAMDDGGRIVAARRAGEWS